ncbi:discoidin domain-containing protein [Spartinivicinus poritis]|uniref:Discoidin domain-containing protein n=1 Tax=Spartinivicinus poritis TaxID=2994640 RepID=A0ABT5UE96_9GAMM|nr:discoidin domain-containing protein [Spartinivicinus sp. A2-2]MDE1464692.1 discoidin domain-containing protein [Spartinivicinus sp. A2-2]
MLGSGDYCSEYCYSSSTHTLDKCYPTLYIILGAFFILTTLAQANPVSLNKPVWVSSVESYQLDARFAVEGRLDTRWSSQFTDGHWITIDLGNSLPIKQENENQ